MRRDIEERYPRARIEGLEKQQLIPTMDEKEKKKAELKKTKKKKERLPIRVVE